MMIMMMIIVMIIIMMLIIIIIIIALYAVKVAQQHELRQECVKNNSWLVA